MVLCLVEIGFLESLLRLKSSLCIRLKNDLQRCGIRLFADGKEISLCASELFYEYFYGNC